MALLLLSKQAAIDFIGDELDLDAEQIVVTANPNGTFTGTKTFTPVTPAPQPPPAPVSADEAKSAAKNALDANAAKITLTRTGGQYIVVST